MKNRILSRVLVLCMVLNLFPTISILADADPSYTTGLFAAKFSQNQIFDFIQNNSRLNGLSFDSSWGTSSMSGGHQFSNAHLTGRYFVYKYSGDNSYPVALFLYNNDGTPVVSDEAGNFGTLSTDSLIGLASNVCLTPSGQTYMTENYGDGISGLVAQGTVTKLDVNGLLFVSKNDFGYYIAGNQGYEGDETIVWDNPDTSVTMDALASITTFSDVALTSTQYAVIYNENTTDLVTNIPATQIKTQGIDLSLSGGGASPFRI